MESIDPSFSISNMCKESLPCIHTVCIDGVESSMNGVKIFEQCIARGLDVPMHFEHFRPVPDEPKLVRNESKPFWRFW